MQRALCSWRLRLVPLLALVCTLGPLSVPAHALSFGPELAATNANYPYSCGSVGLLSGCTVEDPLVGDMDTLLPEPITHGDQRGVVTAIHVKASAEEPAQFVVVEWSGRPGAGEPFPSGVMALSEVVTLRPGINNFNANLPVDRRFLSNGYETWSQLALSVLNATSPIPAEAGGAYAYSGTISDRYRPLTQTVEDLTLPPHEVLIGGLYPGTLLISGEVKQTTSEPVNKKEEAVAKKEEAKPPPLPPAAPQIKLPALGRFNRKGATLPLSCIGPAGCAGTLTITNGVAPGAILARARRVESVTYASASFSIAAGKTASVLAKLTKAGRRALTGRRTLKVYVNVRLSGGRYTSWPITLRG